MAIEGNAVRLVIVRLEDGKFVTRRVGGLKSMARPLDEAIKLVLDGEETRVLESQYVTLQHRVMEHIGAQQ